MDEERIRQIIREELSNILKNNRYVFDKDIQILDKRCIQTGRYWGTQIGTAVDQKLGFWGKVPKVQPANVGKAFGGVNVDAEARTAINYTIASLEDIGILEE